MGNRDAVLSCTFDNFGKITALSLYYSNGTVATEYSNEQLAMMNKIAYQKYVDLIQ